ncbi:asialoglycoprotein receptor 1-like [Ambystoma mexicanum]|uniref:asialoglycoprotein receptor 1-like n=1 Tax=Ambystoma mexicanum TaxID=8296 RepID=UPI0037E88955
MKVVCFPLLAAAMLLQTEGSMQEKLNTMEAALKKLEADKSIETVQQGLMNLQNTVDQMKCALRKLSSNDSTSNCCPDEWVGFAGSCYFFSKTGRSWDDSKKFYASLRMSAYLVVINTDAEQQFLQTKTIPAYTWIGLTDVDGTWKWVDGTNYETTPKQWIPGQPDEYFRLGLGGGEDCAHMHQQGQWNDEHCSRLYNAVCEKKMLESL